MEFEVFIFLDQTVNTEARVRIKTCEELDTSTRRTCSGCRSPTVQPSINSILFPQLDFKLFTILKNEGKWYHIHKLLCWIVINVLTQIKASWKCKR